MHTITVNVANYRKFVWNYFNARLLLWRVRKFSPFIIFHQEQSTHPLHQSFHFPFLTIPMVARISYKIHKCLHNLHLCRCWIVDEKRKVNETIEILMKSGFKNLQNLVWVVTNFSSRFPHYSFVHIARGLGRFPLVTLVPASSTGIVTLTACSFHTRMWPAARSNAILVVSSRCVRGSRWCPWQMVRPTVWIICGA